MFCSWKIEQYKAWPRTTSLKLVFLREKIILTSLCQIIKVSSFVLQEEIVEKIREFAKDIGLIDDNDDDSVNELANSG